MSAVSSANWLHLVWEFVHAGGGGGRSIVYTRKRRGPRTEPLGTPAGMDFHDDKAEPTLTRCRRRVRQLVSQVRAMPRTPRCSSLARRPACQTRSKAFDKSKQHADTA